MIACRLMPMPEDTTQQAPSILVIEDDRDILDAIRLILESRGYVVVALDRVEKMAAEVELRVPHLVLLDIWVGGGDGREAAKWLRRHEPTKNVPIIMVSANMATQQIAKEVKADDFILKPFDLDHLLSTVERRLKKSTPTTII
jgi:DNA-binding response OmpR family regulator